MIMTAIEEEKMQQHHNFPKYTFCNKNCIIHKNNWFLFILSLIVIVFVNIKIASY